MNHCLIRLVVFALYHNDEDKAVRMLRRRKICPLDGSTVSDIDVKRWQQCVNYLTPYLLLPWFIPWFIPRRLLHHLPTVLCRYLSNMGFLTHLDVLDDIYYANSAHGTASIDFIIQKVDCVLEDMGPPPLRRSCTGWYPTASADVSMTEAERMWLNCHIEK